MGPLFEARSRYRIGRLHSRHLRKSGSGTYEDPIKGLLRHKDLWRHSMKVLLRTLGEERVRWAYCFRLEAWPRIHFDKFRDGFAFFGKFRKTCIFDQNMIAMPKLSLSSVNFFSWFCSGIILPIDVSGARRGRGGSPRRFSLWQNGSRRTSTGVVLNSTRTSSNRICNCSSNRWFDLLPLEWT